MTTNASAMMIFMKPDYSTSPSSAAASRRPDSPRRRGVILAATLVGMAVTARLGIWQLDRADQKHQLQATLDQRATMPPLGAVDLARTPDEVDNQLQRRIQLQGRWISRATVFLDNRPMDGRVGFYIVTPLQMADGSAVLVQRGWAPRHALQRDLLPPVDTPDGPVQISARIIPAPSRLFNLGGNETGPIRQNLDIETATRESGLTLRPVTLLQTDAAGQDGLRRDWPAPSLGIDKHHGYAVQWFALCALMAGLYVWFQLIRPRRQAATHAQ